MTNWAEHYKAVRQRLNQAAQIKRATPKKPIEDYVMPVPLPEVSESVEQIQRRRLKGCPLSMRRQALVLPLLVLPLLLPPPLLLLLLLLILSLLILVPPPPPPLLCFYC